MGDLDRLLADGDLDGLLRLVDEACDDGDWDALEGVATRSRAAVERGHQLWPAADHAEHRLALQAPAELAAAAVLRDTTTFGVAPLAEVVSHGQVAGPDASLLHQPSNAIALALGKAGMAVGDLDLVEVNEAFAAVALASMDALGLPDDVVNVNGGAIALGHPIGMSGTRIALTLAHELKRRGGGTGAAGLCGGGGQGEALVLRVAA